MARPHNVATPVEYEINGETKTRWVNCGVLFKLDNDRFKIILDAAPINGQLVAFPPKDDDDRRGGNDGKKW